MMFSALLGLALAAAPVRDGRHDFDWEIGRWATSLKLLLNPLSGEAPKWAEYRGTSVIKPLLDGRANFVELSVEGASGKIEGGSLRLFNPAGQQWSLNFANLRNGLLTTPMFGGFDAGGTGSFFGTDTVEGKTVLVRFIITRPAKDTARFEQAYSMDGGARWEVNWVAVDTLVRP